MIGKGLSGSRRTPRWWRKLLVESRRANLFLLLELAVAAALLAMVAVSWATVFNAEGVLPNSALSASATARARGWAVSTGKGFPAFY